MRRIVQALVGIAISGAALWLTLRGKDVAAIAQEIRVADYRYLAPYVLILVGIHLARTVRWGLLLEPVAKLPFSKLNAVSAVGFMALVVLPFRLGEFARPYLVAERPRLRVSSALSSVVVERVVDGVFTGLLLVVSLLAVPDGTPGVRLLRTAGVVVSLAFLALLAFLVGAYRNRVLAVRFSEALLRPFSPRLAARASGMLDAFIHGLRLVPSRRKLALFLLLTAGYWGLNAWGMALLARGFGFQLGAVEACTILGVLVVGVMIPAGPGMIGTFQGAIVLGLSLFASREAVATRGVAFANVIWAVQLAQQVALGLFFLFSRHIQLGRLFAAPGAIETGLEAEEAEYRGEPGAASRD
ncbi:MULTISPECIES: lysylphosphatidylglycerol synthase transmembrane domain-containing protein [Anaeromyxobacter]|uniref:lysylphosphatidylglycerol synthase transmembrane domain-containing protein n=1 Tax=Anaeromyxobacter TaxID=161492 RepID=UPI001F56F301|nr:MULTISPECIES: lysylphosphatidylglycerol synthase transmembrane domain-containing protein [unclassified Anaeromyxobacter]